MHDLRTMKTITPKTIDLANLATVTGGRLAVPPGGGGEVKRPLDPGAGGLADGGAGIAGKAGHR